VDAAPGPGMAREEHGQADVFDAGLLVVPGLEALGEIHAGRSRQMAPVEPRDLPARGHGVAGDE
jgi:hypothetical protein